MKEWQKERDREREREREREKDRERERERQREREREREPIKLIYIKTKKAKNITTENKNNMMKEWTSGDKKGEKNLVIRNNVLFSYL